MPSAQKEPKSRCDRDEFIVWFTDDPMVERLDGEPIGQVPLGADGLGLTRTSVAAASSPALGMVQGRPNTATIGWYRDSQSISLQCCSCVSTLHYIT